MDLQHRIKEMLGKGLQATVVANAVGCDPSYISQLMEQEEFKTDVLIARSALIEAGLTRDSDWDSIEDLALKRVKDTIHLVTNPRDMIRIAETANRAKRRAVDAQGLSGDQAAPSVVLMLPENAAIKLEFNRESQVLSVDGRSMAALATNKLAGMVKNMGPAQDVTNLELELVTPAKQAERKKVVSVLESIGFADTPPEVMDVLNMKTPENV